MDKVLNIGQTQSDETITMDVRFSVGGYWVGLTVPILLVPELIHHGTIHGEAKISSLRLKLSCGKLIIRDFALEKYVDNGWMVSVPTAVQVPTKQKTKKQSQKQRRKLNE